MDRNSIIGILLIIAILFGYQYLTMPSAEERALMQHEQDSIAEVAIQKQADHADSALAEQQQQVKNATLVAPVDTGLVADSLNTDSLLAAKQHDRLGIFGPSASGHNEVVTISNENLQVAINTFGARPNVIRLKGYKTYHEHNPLLLSVPDSGAYEYNFFLGNRKLSTKDMNFTAEKLGTTGVRLRASTTDPSKYLQITYQLDSGTWFMNTTAELVGLPEIRSEERDVPLEPHRFPQ